MTPQFGTPYFGAPRRRGTEEPTTQPAVPVETPTADPDEAAVHVRRLIARRSQVPHEPFTATEDDQ